jgi:GNAT superfamily N-acetyltransferase
MALTLRDATQAEQERLPSFLPRWDWQAGDHFVVAEAASPTRIAGGVVFGERRSGRESPVTLVDFTVYPRFRESGLMELLVETAVARSPDLSGYELLAPQAPGTPELAALQRLGFAEHRQLICHEFGVEPARARGQANHDRVTRGGAIPAGVEVVRLTARLWPDVARLVLAEKLMDAPVLKRIGRADVSSYFSAASCVLLVDGQVKGLLFARAMGRRSEVMALAKYALYRGHCLAGAGSHPYVGRSRKSPDDNPFGQKDVESCNRDESFLA